MEQTDSMGSKPIHNLIIGIDPDTEASGWACIDIATREILLETNPLHTILDLLSEFRTEINQGYLDVKYTYRFVV